MKLQKRIFYNILLSLVLWLPSCSTAIENPNTLVTVQPIQTTIKEIATELPNAFPTVQPTQIATEEKVTVVPTEKLQITHIQNDDNFGELYTLDVNCIKNDKTCFDEPKLLFRTLTMPSNEKNKPRGLLTDYSWSPDGNKIALISAGDILIGDMNTQTWVNITNSPDIDEYQPKWSSDGKLIYYRACPRTIEGNYGGHGSCKLYRYDLKGNAEFSLLNSKSDYYNSYDISPDGQKIIFSLTDNKGYDQLYQANVNGSDIHQITSGGINNSAPSFSPDGKKIVFVRSNKPDTPDIVLQVEIILKDLASKEERNLTEKSDNNIFSPVFSPDGKWVAFSSFDADLNANIFIVSLDKSVLVQVTHNNHEVDPSWRLISRQ